MPELYCFLRQQQVGNNRQIVPLEQLINPAENHYYSPGYQHPGECMFRKFRLPGTNKIQHFLCTHHGDSIEVSKDNIIIDHTPSLLAKRPGVPVVVKLVKPRRKLEYIKLLYHRSRLTKEITGNNLMKSLGFRVPVIYESGVTLFPFLLPGYLGYYVMEDLHQGGYKEVVKMLSDPQTGDEVRKEILKNVYTGLDKLKQNRIVFSDFHFSNVLYHPEQEMAWIDTGVTVFPFYRNNFEQKFDHSVNRVLNTGFSKCLNEDEKQRFAELLHKPRTASAEKAA